LLKSTSTELIFDYCNFGESGDTLRQMIHIKQQHEDFHAAIGFARSQATIDPERIVLWDTSPIGDHVFVVAATDPQLTASTSNESNWERKPQAAEQALAVDRLRCVRSKAF